LHPGLVELALQAEIAGVQWAAGSGQWAVRSEKSEVEVRRRRSKVACNSPAVFTACKASSISLA
jgi:hypothetical protein